MSQPALFTVAEFYVVTAFLVLQFHTAFYSNCSKVSQWAILQCLYSSSVLSQELYLWSSQGSDFMLFISCSLCLLPQRRNLCTRRKKNCQVLLGLSLEGWLFGLFTCFLGPPISSMFQLFLKYSCSNSTQDLTFLCRYPCPSQWKPKGYHGWMPPSAFVLDSGSPIISVVITVKDLDWFLD